MPDDLVLGYRLYEFFASRGYAKSYEEFGKVALKPGEGFEIGYLPVVIYYNQPYPKRCLELTLKKEGFTLTDFEEWADGQGH